MNISKKKESRKNYFKKNHINKWCNLFKWFDNDIIDKRDLKIERWKGGRIKKFKLNNELDNTKRWLKISIMLRIFYLWFKPLSLFLTNDKDLSEGDSIYLR